jgi:hypothetical protein
MLNSTLTCTFHWHDSWWACHGDLGSQWYTTSKNQAAHVTRSSEHQPCEGPFRRCEEGLEAQADSVG